MQTREIPQDQWASFLGECSRRHKGQPVTIEAVGGALHGVQSKAFELPLIRIADQKTDAGDHIEVVAGDGEGVRHVVKRPTHVRVFEEGSASLIEIQASDGRSTRVRFGCCDTALPPGNVC